MMNKSEFKKALKEKLNLEEDKITIINDILEDHFFIGKKNKNKIITDLINKLNIDESKANDIYNATMQVIGNGIKDTLKHPFRSKKES